MSTSKFWGGGGSHPDQGWRKVDEMDLEGSGKQAEKCTFHLLQPPLPNDGTCISVETTL